MSTEWTPAMFNTANRMRNTLIKAKHSGIKLTEVELQTLEDLQRECAAYVNAKCPPQPLPEIPVIKESE